MVKFSSLLPVALLGLKFAQATSDYPTTLNISAVTGHNGVSVLECWSLPGLAPYTEQPGALTIPFGNASSAVYTFVPAQSDGGLHVAPSPRWVIFLSGLAHVTLPNSTQEAWITGGRYGVTIAADDSSISKLGHESTFPGDSVTIVLEIPFENGISPEHTVLHSGPCTLPEQTGY